MIDLNLDVISDIEKHFTSAESRLDMVRISRTNYDEVHEIFEEVKSISLNADHFLKGLDAVQIDEKKQELRTVKKELTDRVMKVLEGADTALRKCQNYENILKGNTETGPKLRQTPKKKQMHSPP